MTVNHKTIFLFFIFLISTKNLDSQGACAFEDDRGFLYTYMNDVISKQEILQIDTFMSSSNYVAYIDKYGRFRLVVNHKKYTIYPVPPDSVVVSNYLMSYSLNGQLGVFNGKASKAVETFIKGTFKSADSVIAYVDNYDVFKVYVFDTIYEMGQWIEDDKYKVGNNIVGFITPNEEFKAFYHGQIFEVESQFQGEFEISEDMIVYHDYMERFYAFDHGEVINIEDYVIEDFTLLNSSLVYENAFSEWMLFYKGEKTKLLSTKPSFFKANRNVAVYADNASNFFVIDEGKSIRLESFLPNKVEIWDDMVIYEDMNRVLWGYLDGKRQKVSPGIVKDWTMQNSCVIFYDLTPNVKSVWNNGTIYIYNEFDDPSEKE